MKHVVSVVTCVAFAMLLAVPVAVAREGDTAPGTEAAAEPAVPGGAPTKEIKLIVQGRAKSDGQIRLVVEPEGGSPVEVSVTIQKGMGKQAVCRDIAKELSVALGADFRVRQYDDDKLKVERKDGGLLRMTLAGQTVSGIGIRLK